MAIRGARRSPTTRAPDSRSSASSAVRSPFTAPRTTMRRAEMLAATRPLASTTTSPVAATSPSMRPAISRSPVPVTRPRTKVPPPMTVVAVEWVAISHVHVDVALGLGTVRDGDACSLHVSDDLRAVLEVDAVVGGDVARDGARDGDGPARDVGLDDATVLDRHCVLRDELPAERALHDDVL